MIQDLGLYRDLFVHRDDVYAMQNSNGSYFPIKEPFTDYELVEHLGGQASYGVYVIEPGGADNTTTDENRIFSFPNTVKYVVFDLDTYAPEAWAWLTECLRTLVDDFCYDEWDNPRRCLLAENSGGKGYHVWLFLSEPTPAAKVRRWLAADFLPMWHQESGDFPGTPLEIFPKQDAVPVLGGYGNLVKLPLGVHAVSGRRSEFVPYEGWASGIDNVQRLDVSLIPEIPTGPLPRKDGTSSSTSRPVKQGGERGAGPTPFACISHIIEEGVGRGNRDNGMFHFARYAAGAGLPEDLVLEWCMRVNEGFDPPLSDREVGVKVRSAFGMESPHPGCNADWLRGFCPGGEDCFAPWNTERANNKPTVDDGSDYLTLSPHERRLLRGQT